MKRHTFLLFLGIAALFAACSSNEGEGELKDNQYPTVWLSAGPPEGSTGKYRVQMFWGGWDPDGEIAGYEYIVADNATGVFLPADTIGLPWRPVAGNDSIFTFSADQPVNPADTVSTVAFFTRSHTFFIRSVDTEGLRSRAPAYRSFTSRTLSPEVIIDIPMRQQLNAIDVPPIPTFRWHARDYVDDLSIEQDPDSVQYALIDTEDEKIPGHGLNRFEQAAAYLNTRAGQEEWYPWVYYRAPQDSGKFWTTPPIDGGTGGAAKTYVFAVRAKDEAGAVTPVLDEFKNWRRIKVAARNRGPLMSVSNEYIGIIRTVSCATPVTILDSPAGVPLEFRVSATAEDYGGLVAGYRYGWDIPNLDDPEQWEVDLTPFLPGTTSQLLPARTFFFGTHTLTIEVVDNSGYCSRIEIKVNVVQFTLERSLLVVDDDDLDQTPTAGLDLGVYPNDLEHDDFWLEMTSEVSGFDPEIDLINARAGEIPLVKLSQYKSIIWLVDNNVGTQTPTSLLSQYISHRQKNPPPGSTGGGGKVRPNILALAMAAGGHVMVCGTHPINLVVTRPWRGSRYPLIFALELEGDQHNPPPLTSDPIVGDLSFAYRDLCLETIDYGVQNTTRIRKRNAGNGKIAYCPLDFIRPVGSNSDRDDSMRKAVPFDPNFPDTLTIRPEVSGPTNFYAPASRGLDVEVYNPAYFRRSSGKPGACEYVPPSTRPCFQPIYILGSNDTAEPSYHQPVAFWTSVYANRVADVPGAVGARSVVFGFAPVLTNPAQFQTAMDYILFDEWQLPRGSSAANLRANAE